MVGFLAFAGGIGFLVATYEVALIIFCVVMLLGCFGLLAYIVGEAIRDR